MASPKIIIQCIGADGNRYEKQLTVTPGCVIGVDKDGALSALPSGQFGAYTDPNSNVYAPQGGRYYGPDGSCWYRNTSGIGNTGWVELLKGE